MKKSLLLTFLLIFLFANAHTYAFDFLTKYKLKGSDPKRETESVNYFNSDVFSYYLRLMKAPDTFRALLTDTERMIAHRFTITENKVKGEIIFAFTYDYSFKLNDRAKGIENRIEFSEVPGSPNQVLMKNYTSKKVKKPSSEHLLTLAPANKNLFPMYSISRSKEINQHIEYPGNYIVTRDEITEGKYRCEFVLDMYKNVDLQLTLPEKLKF